jgi:hypothetical protein
MTMAQTPTPVANGVLLNLSFQDPGLKASGLHTMRFSRDGVNCTPWESYQTMKALATDRGGALTVRAQVVDRAWNVCNIKVAVTAVAPPAGKTLFVDANAANASGQGTVARPYGRIQQALDAASTGATIFVTPGTYKENIDFKGKNVVLSAQAPQVQAVVKITAIDGRTSGSAVVRFRGTESATCRLEGFTLTHGKSQYGAGISGNGTHATIQNNRITDNVAFHSHVIFTGIPLVSWEETHYESGYGGGLANCHGLIQNNVIAFNIAGYPVAAAAPRSSERSGRVIYIREF